MAHARIIITTVLIAVARSESTPFIPNFAKMATSAANKAESKAYIHHMRKPDFKFEVSCLKLQIPVKEFMKLMRKLNNELQYKCATPMPLIKVIEPGQKKSRNKCGTYQTKMFYCFAVW